MKPRVAPFIGWSSGTAALVLILGCLFAPAFCQSSEVALLLQQTPYKGGAITPDVGVYHFKMNSEVILTASPKPGYQFAYWLGDVSDPSSISTMVYLDKPKIIIAVFELSGYGMPTIEKGFSGGGGIGGGGGSGFVNSAMTFGQSDKISSAAGGVKQKLNKTGYPKTEAVPEPATGVLLILGCVIAFVRRRAGNKP
ncbi:MAG: PEP-CTERM sorting domain-containing protein [Sedimentisphaerales bacterium]|nr:PEP-CTERM sorting domain-containing protein [Sedimentisphaerales bacterium]